MELKKIPGAPGYYVDCDNYEIYKFNGRDIRKLTLKPSGKTTNIQINGRPVGTSAYRCAFAAMHGIDITKIPTEYCISHDGQKVVVHTRSTLKKASLAAKAKSKEAEIERNYKTLKRNWGMIDKYINGNHEPLETYLEELQLEVFRYYHYRLGFCEERSDIIAGGAINEFQAMIDRGDVDCHIRRRVFSFAVHMRYATTANKLRQSDAAIFPEEIEIPDIATT